MVLQPPQRLGGAASIPRRTQRVVFLARFFNAQPTETLPPLLSYHLIGGTVPLDKSHYIGFVQSHIVAERAYLMSSGKNICSANFPNHVKRNAPRLRQAT